jgi:hypothetical protein
LKYAWKFIGLALRELAEPPCLCSDGADSPQNARIAGHEVARQINCVFLDQQARNAAKTRIGRKHACGSKE